MRSESLLRQPRSKSDRTGSNNEQSLTTNISPGRDRLQSGRATSQSRSRRKIAHRLFLVVLLLAAHSESMIAQSDWQATTRDGETFPEIYRLNGNTDTLVSAPSASEGRVWRQFPISDIRELRKVYSDLWWYMPAATFGIGTAAVLINGRSFDDGLVAFVSALFVGGATLATAGTAAVLAKDEVHDLASKTPQEKESVVGARIPIAFGSPEEGLLRFDPASPPGRRISALSGWGGLEVGHVSWSDGYNSSVFGASASYWSDEHLMTARFRWGRDLSVHRGTLALLYGRGIALERIYGTVSVGPAYEFSVFEPGGPAAEAYHPLFHTAGLVLDADIVWPVSSWFGVGLAASSGVSFEGAYWALTLSLLAGDLE